MDEADPARFRLEFEKDVVAGFGPVMASVVVLMSLFIPYNLLALSSGLNVRMALHDGLVASLAGLLWWMARRDRIEPRMAAPLASLVALAILSNVLHAMVALQDPFNTVYVGVLLIAIAGTMVQNSWVFATIAISCVAWLLSIFMFADSSTIWRYSFFLLACAFPALAIQRGRSRSVLRISELRHREVLRQKELEQALAVAEEGRRTLDLRVAERTSELSEKTRALHKELEDRKRDAREREELGSQLLQAQKLESVGRLAGGIAHDLNNLLTVISGGVEEARGAKGAAPEAAEALDDAATATARAGELTRQLLAFGRKQIIQPRRIDLGVIVQGFQKMLLRAVSEKVRLVVEVPSSAKLMLFADPGQLEQVIMNLAINASDAMNSGGKLTVGVTMVVLDGSVDRGGSVRPKGDYVVLRVADEGEGISPENLPAIFEPFFTTKAPGKGTGLGLAVVHGVVSQNGGFIEVSSTVGTGTEFRLYFPRASATSSAPGIPIAQRRSTWLPEPGNATILLAEDEDALRNLAARTLRRRGYEVLDARDGEHALQLAAAHNGPIHLLITDVVMPNMDGPALSAQIKRIFPALPVLFTSGYAEDRIAHQGILDEGVAFLPKPYTLAGLVARAQDMLKAAGPQDGS